MPSPASIFNESWFVYAVATGAVATLLATIFLLRRRNARGAGVVCLLLSIALHAALLFGLPHLTWPGGGLIVAEQPTTDNGEVEVELSTFDPDMTIAENASEITQADLAALPLAVLEQRSEADAADSKPADAPEPATLPLKIRARVIDSFDAPPHEPLPETPDLDALLDSALDQWVQAKTPVADVPVTAVPDNPAPEIEFESEVTPEPSPPEPIAPPTAAMSEPVEAVDASESRPVATTTTAARATVVGDVPGEFANRRGRAKIRAIRETGGDARTEAAVAAALSFLADAQDENGSWAPAASGAGRERSPLGTTRGNAGGRAETALTGLALLSMIGAGNTHREGIYAENVYRGLARLIEVQKPDGSLAGDASVYAATYAHGMAALAMVEIAAITGDPSAIESARRATNYTLRLQHPATGGWRYFAGDPGDVSQLGWQAMVLDAAIRAEIDIPPQRIDGVSRFLRSVRRGRHGGLACYRDTEPASRAMTAEALATRLLIGETVPPAEIAEAEAYLLQELPGTGQDNYYYWYYATLALHQLQDDAWQTWNEALKTRLLASQDESGNWSADSLWGGYGGTVYTTAMAALCLETYYRHEVRTPVPSIATRP